ncbi:MAG: KH domain-containing protein [Clostridia bacterium]|nr:KH domain-containing protein [Clostridia bacterium]
MKSIESVGKNVEQAIENGLKELGCTRDKVTIEIKETGGLFKKAKVVLTLDSEIEKEKKEREENIKRLEELEQSGALDNDFSSLLKNSKINEEKLEKDATNEQQNENYEKVQESTLKICENQVENENSTVENDVKEEINFEVEKQEKNVTLSKGAEKVKEFSNELLQKMGIEATTEINETRDSINVELVGREANKIIGKRGDGLNAFQYLCSVVGSRFDRDCGRVYIDACGYKEEREQELIKLARKLKYSAVRDDKVIKLEPMSALDRKTIHKALADDDLVETYSEGEEPRRYIVIAPKRQEKV